MNNATKSILIAGVGGQGILRASDILCLAFMATGLDVKKSEVHGMAQRGGSVTSHVRYGAKVYSPIARKGDVDILVSFEKLETLRYLDYLKADGVVMINEEEIYPPSVNLGDAIYPINIVEYISKYFKRVKYVAAPAIARRAGDIKAVNMVLLGALSNELTIADDIWERVMKESFPQKAMDVNLQAFNLGKRS
ncbi:MAG: indolepyruvate oxidoreductase subunit beta [Syntrophus sp. (in: bacteria)]|nr:indolepyruvate oxidoreductase subunit beta [Syntrophus sp. (in: bacteria)]